MMNTANDSESSPGCRAPGTGDVGRAVTILLLLLSLGWTTVMSCAITMCVHQPRVSDVQLQWFPRRQQTQRTTPLSPRTAASMPSTSTWPRFHPAIHKKALGALLGPLGCGVGRSPVGR